MEDQVLIFMSSSDRMVQSHTEAQGFLFIDVYGSWDYGGGILTCLHTGKVKEQRQFVLFIRMMAV
jgi:hypothetical protein